MVEPWRGEFRRGLERLRRGEFALAEAHFARAHRLAPERAEVCFALGRERLRAGDLEQAELLLAQAWRLDSSLLGAAAFLARAIGLERRQFDRAHQVLAQGFARHGRAAALAVVEAEIFLEEGRTEEARRAAEAVLEGADEALAQSAARALLARVHNGDGLARVADGDTEAALFAFRRAADLDPEWSAPESNLGAAFEALGRTERARAAYQRALAIDPDNPTAWFNLVRLLRRKGETGAALGLLESAGAFRAAASDPDLLLVTAQLLLDSGAADRAEQILGRALEFAPDHAGVRMCLAELLLRDGRYLEAAELASRAPAASGGDGD
jgi:tetratricopeptide (TPR) repeat protein